MRSCRSITSAITLWREGAACSAVGKGALGAPCPVKVGGCTASPCPPKGGYCSATFCLSGGAAGLVIPLSSFNKSKKAKFSVKLPLLNIFFWLFTVVFYCVNGVVVV